MLFPPCLHTIDPSFPGSNRFNSDVVFVFMQKLPGSFHVVLTVPLQSFSSASNLHTISIPMEHAGRLNWTFELWTNESYSKSLLVDFIWAYSNYTIYWGLSWSNMGSFDQPWDTIDNLLLVSRWFINRTGDFYGYLVWVCLTGDFRAYCTPFGNKKCPCWLVGCIMLPWFSRRLRANLVTIWTNWIPNLVN